MIMSRKQPPGKAKVAETPTASKELRSDELHEADLDKVAGGRKAGKDQQEFLTVTMKDALVTSIK
jgi:hypothetical protein